ncbi:MAG: hypothetical protein K0S05_338 [Agromyces sp.]|nr:hypothetical protein [Agromyces sp.]
MPEISQQPEPVAESEPIAEPVAETESVAETVETAATDVPAPAPVADAVLLAAVDLARRALLEVTRPETVGSVVGHLVEDEHVLTLLFASDLSGYPGWHWSVTIARVEGAEPTVLETELMPGDAALLAPEWVPWSERLEEGDEDFDDELDEDEDETDLDDEAELDAAFGRDAGDDEFDGIDIDSLDESAGDDDADEVGFEDADADVEDADDSDTDQSAEPRS